MSWRDRMEHVTPPDITPDPEVTEEQLLTQAEPTTPDQTYVVLKHETMTAVAKKLNIPASELAEHNDLRTWDLVEGQELHLPYPRSIPTEQKPVRYEELPYPKTFHISKEGGARKYAFGNHRTLDDITPTGATYPTHKTFPNIVAAAVIDIEGVEYAYWMDTVTYDVEAHKPFPGRLYGFALGHLTEGTAPDPEPELALASEVPPTPVQLQVAETVAAIEPKLDERKWNAPYVHPVGPNPSPNKWKHTFRELPDGDTWFITNKSFICHDHDNKRPDVTVGANKSYLLSHIGQGKDGKTYYRRRMSANEGSWHLIPQDYVTEVIEEQDEAPDLYTAPVDKTDDKLLNPHKYGWDKFIVTPVLRGAAQVHRITPQINKIKQKVRKIQ